MAESQASDLIDFALVALFELTHEAGPDPYPSSRQLRFLLAFLHAQSRCDPAFHRQFWRMAVGQPGKSYPELRAMSRRQGMDAAFKAICRQHGRNEGQIEARYFAQEKAWKMKREHSPYRDQTVSFSSGRRASEIGPTSPTSSGPFLPDQGSQPV